MKKFFKYFFLALAVILFIALLYWLFAPKQKDTSIETGSLEKGDVFNKRYISGKIIPLREVELKAQISGIVEKIFVKEGESVSVGQQVARVSLLANPSNVENASNAYSIAQVNFKIAKEKFKRNQGLFNKGIISKSEFETYEKEFEIAEQELKSAKVRLEIVQKGYAEGKKEVSNIVHSTINGVVVSLPVEEGGSVTERNTFNDGTTIAEISDMNRLIFEGKIPEKEIQYLSIGTVSTITINALNDKKIPFRLIEISPKGVEEEGIVKFKFKGNVLIKDNRDLTIRHGYTGIAEFILEKALDVMTINERYLQQVKDSTFVYVLKGTKTERKDVKIGISDGIKVEIKEGLEEDDKLVEEEIK